jgi:thiol-disulfide isomerase/thioredoxin
MRKRTLRIAVFGCCFQSIAALAGELSVGDPAPPLQVSRWIKGKNLERCEPGKVYVVDFWATWCGPCIETFPHLTRLQQKYADKGVTIIGVSIWEGDGAAVEPFVKARGDTMGYSVALDDVPSGKENKGEKGGFSGKMAKAWMKSAGRNLIPTAFIVGKDGKIAWVGGPRDIDEPLERIVAGKWYRGAPDKEFVVPPAPAPVPAMRYALLPLDPDRTPGDAAPIYLRLRSSRKNGEMDLREASSKATEWLRQPLRDLPTHDATVLLERWSDQLRQIEFASKRRTCDWNYTIPEQGEQLIMVRLDSAFEMVSWSTLLALKARVEISERRYDDALQSIANGLAFNHHVAEGPFLMHPSIGVAGSLLMLDRIDELITLPGAPNLYWALTALPRPLINFRSAMENEARLVERLLPELTDFRRRRSDADWPSVLARISARMDGIHKMIGAAGSDKAGDNPPRTNLGRLKAELLPAARTYVAGLPKTAQPANAPMSDDQMIVIYIAGWYRERWDDLFKSYYLPYPEARQFYAAALARHRSEVNHPLTLLTDITPSVSRFHEQEAELDRRVAALRAVEALRLCAAANEGRPPAPTNAAANTVPIPRDSVTGEPFQYTSDGETGTLVIQGPPPSRLKVIYRISARN